MAMSKFLGDGVLAYFGYPRDAEDDAERAVRAGLALVQAIARLELADGMSGCRRASESPPGSRSWVT